MNKINGTQCDAMQGHTAQCMQDNATPMQYRTLQMQMQMQHNTMNPPANATQYNENTCTLVVSPSCDSAANRSHKLKKARQSLYPHPPRWKTNAKNLKVVPTQIRMPPPKTIK